MKNSIKLSIVMMVTLIALPFLALNASILVQMMDEEKKYAEDKLFRSLEDGERDFKSLIDSASELLSQIAEAVKGESPAEMERIFGLLIEPFKERYASAGFVDEKGLVVKTFPPASSFIDVSDRPWFQKVQNLKSTIVGHYLVERVTGRPGLVIAQAVEKPDGSFGGAVFVVIHCFQLQNILKSLVLPADAVATIRDSEGLVLARTVDPEKWIGKQLPEADIFQKISTRTDRGAVRARGVDGIERIYVYSFLGSALERGGVYLSIGIPTEKVFEAVNQQALTRGSIAVGISLFAVVCGWIFAKRFILTPVEEIKKAMEEFALGSRARISVPSAWPSELKSLAVVFNSMGDKLAESFRKYEESQSDLRRLIEQIPGVLYRAETDSPVSYVFVSSRLRELLGMDETIEYPFPWLDFVHAQDRERVLYELEEFTKHSGNTQFRSEYRIVDKAGNVKWIRDEAVKIYSDGKLMIQGIWRDISWRVRSDREMRVLKEALDKSSDGFAIVGNRGNILWANRSFLMMVECPEIQLCEDIKNVLLPIVALDQTGIDFLKAIEERRSWRGRIRAFPKPEKEASVWDVSVSLVTEGDETRRRLLFLRDVTKEVNLQNQLFIAQKMESLGMLATGIAHDFNNILMVILGYAELALMNLPEEHPLKPFLEEIFQAGNRAKHLVDGILGFARGTPQDKVPISLSVLVKENIKFLKQLIPSNIDLVSKIEVPAGENDIVLASPTEFQQVLMNLVVNAVQAIEDQGTITISLKRCLAEDGMPSGLETRKGSYMKLCVSDTGCGIDPSIVHRIFDPCFTTKPPGTGTGMGLTIVYNAVKNMGGVINVESKPGKGTTFKIFLPVLDKEAGEVHEEAEKEEIKAAGGTPGVHHHLLRLLVVDDDEALLKMLKIELEMEKFHVTAFSSAVEALKNFAETPFSFDVAIVDYRMPEMTGLELARQFLSIRPDFPVVMMTGYLDERLTKEANTLGVRSVMAKPISLGELVSVLQAFEVSERAHEGLSIERL